MPEIPPHFELAELLPPQRVIQKRRQAGAVPPVFESVITGRREQFAGRVPAVIMSSLPESRTRRAYENAISAAWLKLQRGSANPEIGASQPSLSSRSTSHIW
jgi:hypothetical protein